MSQIAVSVVPRTARQAMAVRIDPEVNLLVGQTASKGPWPYGINVDNLLILDFEADGILSSFELIIPPKAWVRKELLTLATAGEGALKLCEPVKSSWHLDQTVEVFLDDKKSMVDIRLGKFAGGSLISLSDQCAAVMNRSELVGFRIQLSEDSGIARN